MSFLETEKEVSPLLEGVGYDDTAGEAGKKILDNTGLELCEGLGKDITDCRLGQKDAEVLR